MLKIIAALLLFTLPLFSQTTINGSFEFEGVDRTYSYYLPASYTSGNPVPLLIGLHGTSSSGSAFAQYRDFRPIADTANFIIVNPDGTSLFGIRYWNFGGGFLTVNDVGFIETLIDTLSSQYSIDQDRIYSVGMSNGGFMSYHLACKTNRFAAIGSVTGSMSNEMFSDCTPPHPTPVIHIHGTEDAINPYNGNSSSKSIPDVVRFWVNENQCDTIPSVFPVPDINPTDGATAQRFLYSNGINGNTVEHFKVDGGEHSWPNSPMPLSSDVTCMDFDACIEVWRFFSRFTRNGSASSPSLNLKNSVHIYPNPTSGKVFIQSDQYKPSEVVISDLSGRTLLTFNSPEITEIEIQQLPPGTYLIHLFGQEIHSVQKFFRIAE